MSLPCPTIKQLEAIFWTARLGSLQAAADHLCTTQSAIAKRVSELESIFDVRLLDRSGRRPRLTAEGESLLLCAEDVLEANRRLVSTMSQIACFHGRIRLGVTELVSLTWLSDLVRRIRMAYDTAILEVEVGPGARLMDGVRDGRMDVAILPGAIFDRDFDSTPVGMAQFAWLGSPSLCLPDRVLPMEALARYPILIHTPNGVSTPMVNQQLAGIPGRSTLTANTLVSIVQLAVNGMGISFLPLGCLKPQLDAGRLARIHTEADPYDLEFYAVYRKGGRHPLADAIVEAARETCDFERQVDVSLMAA